MRLIIMGNRVAGITTANLLRRARPDAEIVIYSQEPHHDYPRPRLMDVVAGGVPPERIISHAGDWHRKHRIAGAWGIDPATLTQARFAGIRRLVEGGAPISERDAASLPEGLDLRQPMESDRVHRIDR